MGFSLCSGASCAASRTASCAGGFTEQGQGRFLRLLCCACVSQGCFFRALIETASFLLKSFQLLNVFVRDSFRILNRFSMFFNYAWLKYAQARIPQSGGLTTAFE